MDVEIVKNIFLTSLVVIGLVIMLAFVITMLEGTDSELKLGEGVKIVSGLAVILAPIVLIVTGVALIWM